MGEKYSAIGVVKYAEGVVGRELKLRVVAVVVGKIMIIINYCRRCA